MFLETLYHKQNAREAKDGEERVLVELEYVANGVHDHGVLVVLDEHVVDEVRQLLQRSLLSVILDLYATQSSKQTSKKLSYIRYSCISRMVRLELLLDRCGRRAVLESLGVPGQCKARC